MLRKGEEEGVASKGGKKEKGRVKTSQFMKRERERALTAHATPLSKGGGISPP